MSLLLKQRALADTLSGLVLSRACRNQGSACVQQLMALQMISSGTTSGCSLSCRTTWYRLSHKPQLFRSWQLQRAMQHVTIHIACILCMYIIINLLYKYIDKFYS